MDMASKTVGGMPMRWHEHGSGMPLILIHGIPTGPALWRHVLPRIEAARGLAWEMVGYAGSIPAGRDRDISVAHQADYLVQWMDSLEIEKAIFAGHDLGGGVAQIAAVRHPERMVAAWDQVLETSDFAARRAEIAAFNASSPHRKRGLAACGDKRAPRLGPSPGFKNLRWSKPVFAGDRITYFSEVTDKRASASRPEWGLFFHRNTGVNQHGEEVFSFEGCVFVERLKPAGA